MNRYRLKNLCLNIHIPDAYVEHGNVDLLKQEIGLDGDSIAERILAAYSGDM